MDWPDPMTTQNIGALVTNGDITFTNQLSDLTFNEPDFDAVPISSCIPDRQVIYQRTITGSDRIISSSLEGSPAVETPYYERRRWYEVLQKQGQLGVGVLYCNGDFMPFVDANGNFLTASISAWVNYEAGPSNGALNREMISFSIVFNGDPFGLYNYPTINLSDVI